MHVAIGYTLVLLICTIVILVCVGRVREKYYPYLIYGIGAAMVLMTSLAGPRLVGMDIHLEYYYAQLHSGLDVLPPLVGTPQGTTVANIYLSPLLGHVIPLLWVYKLVYPLLLAVIPVLAYFIFRKWFTTKQSFLGAFILISFPAFFMELPTIVRHTTCELVLMTMLFLIVKSTLPHRYRIPLVILCGALAALCYYTVTILFTGILGVIFLISLFMRRKRLLIGLGILAAVVTGALYYPQADQGAAFIKLGHFYNAYAPSAYEIDTPKMKVPRPVTLRESVVGTVPPDGSTTIVPEGKLRENAGEIKQEAKASTEIVEVAPPNVWKKTTTGRAYYERLGPLIRTAIGLDWHDQSVWGRLFRVFQWLFMLLVPVGLWKVRKNKKYLVFASGGAFLLALVLIPGFTGLLSLTRIVHISLLLLAPAIAVALKPKYLILILIPYFLFTSGFVFEATRQPDIEDVTMPYSYFLSNDRIELGIGASITEDDYKVRQYIYDNELYPVTTDIQGANFMGELVGWRSTWHRAFRTWLGPEKESGNYVFIISRNVETGTFTCWNGAGCRALYSHEEIGVDINKNIIFQSGDARVVQMP